MRMRQQRQPFMASKEEDFAIASYALWAGDVTRAEEILSRIESRKDYRREKDHIEGAKGFIQHTAGLRQWQISYRRSRLTRVAKADKLANKELPPVTVETANLRGVVTMVDSSEYLLRAYILRPEKETSDRIYGNAVRLKASAAKKQRRKITGDTMARTVVWIEPGNVFLRVVMSSLGQVEAKAIWTADRALSSLKPITDRFQQLLNDLSAQTARGRRNK
jgi:hypothetical protein